MRDKNNFIKTKNNIIGTGLINRGPYNQKDCKRVDNVTIKKVIIVHVLRGEGTDKDPCRKVSKYFDMNGEYLFEIDSWDYQD